MPDILHTDHYIASTEPGCRVMLRNKCLADTPLDIDGSRTVLFVHGATYASSLTFDYAIDGESWMDHLARQGFDTWCIDLVGYGGSDRPTAMSEPAEHNPPICDTRLAATDVGLAVTFICGQHNIPRLNLIGYSWGTAIAGTYAGEHPERIRKLALSGALWVSAGATTQLAAGPLGAYRMVDASAAAKRWTQGLDQARIDSLAPAGHIDAWCTDAIASDQANSSADPQNVPPQLRAPTGVLKDFGACAASGEPWYEPAKICAPTLIVVGEWDRETTPEQCQAVFARLERAASKRLTILGGGTHSLLLENQRHALHAVIDEFLLAST